ncbi:Flp family type IVb pilin [Algiphilus aromaticivorans]|jgi:pilus assembly protein Flp/PilA|uniref:Flp family type IVb pilin n=1 Tax=Algiphilus aromaticivorans TaxID=382454 RepID=UPI0005C12E51|nr:Flp family type IVb pilin [Algiphilus aromaticivorans]
MFTYLSVWIQSLLSDDEGASAIEYGLIIGLIAVVLIVVLTNIGTGLNTLFETASSKIAGAG